ncbi:adenosine 3'-phospho 5'-phosphosulfate transporter 2 isoform X4 [Phalacrocorax carbo]|uniref:adenosine 3'-phospho 5'-phosphosulfate transporter 2 isoform X4 n=1 Tax=Phalacrocorax carbo TaxID=9209 RepID=UPI00311A7A41
MDATVSHGEDTEREEQKEHNNNTECSELGVMDLKFTSSRKHISISVPSKSQTMSPHIKSVDDVVVLGMNLSKFNKPTQFFICVSGVFMFYLIYGYLQELIFSVEGFKPFGWYLTLVQFGFYSIFGLIELQLIQDKRRRIPGKTYMIIAFLTVATMGLSNTSLGYLNYPTQVIFKCCKLIPVMIGGVFIQGKRYNIADVSAALCMSLGLIWFTLADSTVAPNFNLTASSSDLWLRIPFLPDGVFWHNLCSSIDKNLWCPSGCNSNNRKKSNDHCAFFFVLCKAIHIPVRVVRLTGCPWYIS